MSSAVGEHSLVIPFQATFTLKIDGTLRCTNDYRVIFGRDLSFKFRISGGNPY